MRYKALVRKAREERNNMLKKEFSFSSVPVFTSSQIDLMLTALEKKFPEVQREEVSGYSLRKRYPNTASDWGMKYNVHISGIEFPGTELSEECNWSVSSKSYLSAWRKYFLDLMHMGVSGSRMFVSTTDIVTKYGYLTVHVPKFASPEEFAMKIALI